MQTHSSVSVNMPGLVQNVSCFLFSYYETSFVIFFKFNDLCQATRRLM